MLANRKTIAKMMIAHEKIAVLLDTLGTARNDFINFILRDGWIIIYEPELPDFITLDLNAVIKYTVSNNTYAVLQQLRIFKDFHNINIHNESKKYKIGESLLLRNINELNSSKAINFATNHEGSKILIIRKIYWISNYQLFASVMEIIARSEYITIKC